MQAHVDSCIMTFVNHGCNGTYNIGDPSKVNEFTADENAIPEDFLGGLSHFESETVYNPVIDRHLRHFMGGGIQTLREIKAGEEVLDNYLDFTGSDGEWKGDLFELRAMCSGQGIGSVTNYEEQERARLSS